jgi:hypothetical protein
LGFVKQLSLMRTSFMIQVIIRFSMPVFFASFLLMPPLFGAGHADEKHMKDAPEGHPSSQAMGICKGFVVLSNGYAVMSGLDIKTEMATGKHGHTTHGAKMDHGQKSSATMDHGDKPHGKDIASMGKEPLMGHRHGENIKPMQGMLCVPLQSHAMQSWTAVSSDPALHITIQSLRGKLAHNSRVNEGFDLNVMSGGVPVNGAQVRLVVHMPHHDRMMPGGHGPANDPDVQGLMAKALGEGSYSVQTVDFSMAGAWLFEVHVSHGGKTSKAYFTTRVGQE